MPEPRQHVEQSDIQVEVKTENIPLEIGAEITASITIQYKVSVSVEEWRRSRTLIEAHATEQVKHGIMKSIYGDVWAIARHAERGFMQHSIDLWFKPLNLHPGLLWLNTLMTIGRKPTEEAISRDVTMPVPINETGAAGVSHGILTEYPMFEYLKRQVHNEG